MNKKETIKLAARYAGISVKDERKAVEAFLCAVSAILDYEEEVVIPDFGKFSVKEYKAFHYRNAVTGEMDTFPATKRVKFKPYSNFTNYYAKYGK